MRKGGASARCLLSAMLLLIGFTLMACDEAPDNAEQVELQDSGIFLAEGKTETGSGELSAKGIVRTRVVELNKNDKGLTALLESIDDPGTPKTTTVSPGINLNLFADVVVVAEVQGSTVEGGQPVFLSGSIRGDETSLVTFMLRGNAISGNVRFGGRFFRIRPAGEGKVRIEEVASVALPEHGSATDGGKQD